LILKSIDHIAVYLFSFSAGKFIYITATNIVPEIKKEPNIKKIHG